MRAFTRRRDDQAGVAAILGKAGEPTVVDPLRWLGIARSARCNGTLTIEPGIDRLRRTTTGWQHMQR